MSNVVRFLRPKRDSDRHGRVLICRRCGDPVRVYELPGEFLRPRDYVCGQCQVDQTMRQLPVPYSERGAA